MRYGTGPVAPQGTESPPVSHVTVSRQEARATLDESALAHVLVLAEPGVSEPALLDAIRARADRSAARFTVVVTADVPSPAWSDEANAHRRDAVDRVHAAVEALQASGVAAQGEVLDGSLDASAGDAVRIHRVPGGAIPLEIGAHDDPVGDPEEFGDVGRLRAGVDQHDRRRGACAFGKLVFLRRQLVGVGHGAPRGHRRGHRRSVRSRR